MGAGGGRAQDWLLLAGTPPLPPFLDGPPPDSGKGTVCARPLETAGQGPDWCSAGEVCHFFMTLSGDYMLGSHYALASLCPSWNYALSPEA